VSASLLLGASKEAELVIAFGGPRVLVEPSKQHPGTSSPLSDLHHWPDTSAPEDTLATVRTRPLTLLHRTSTRCPHHVAGVYVLQCVGSSALQRLHACS
jgi:hypothetical protein